jgi:hypothetical protein
MPVATIPNFLQNPRITGYVRSADVPTTFQLSRWFPLDDVEADEFESLIVLDEVDLAPFVNIDAETPVMQDELSSIEKWAVAYIRYKKRFKESDLRIFWEPGVNDPNSLTAQTAAASERKILRAVDRLSMSIDARIEWMLAGALNGQIAYNDGLAKYTVSYDGNWLASNRKTPTTKWDQSSPTITADLSNWVQLVADATGHDSWAMLTSRKVLGNMARAQDIRELWQVATQNPAFTSSASLNPYQSQQIAQAIGIIGIDEVIRYNAQYTTRTASAGSGTRTRVNFLNENYIWLLPIGVNLGRMATAPARPNNYATGKFAWSKSLEDPWVVETGAGLYGWPDFPSSSHNWLLCAEVVN